MPETRPSDARYFAVRAAHYAELARVIADQAEANRQMRDTAIRSANRDGMGYDQLASLTCLSKTQVQRICDLSKGGNDA